MQIDLQGVGRRFGGRPALVDISMTLNRGVTGLLGPNGAGKTTLMSIIATTLAPFTGRVEIGQHTVFDGSRSEPGLNEARHMIGLLPQRFELMELSTVQRNVEVAAWAHGVPQRDCAKAALRALAAVDLTDRARDRARSLSGGCGSDAPADRRCGSAVRSVRPRLSQPARDTAVCAPSRHPL